MSFSNIQRRAFIIALVTMAGVVTAVLCYWQAVSKGVLPSPVQPMVRQAPDGAPKPATVSARAPASPPSLPPDPITAPSITVPTAPEEQHAQSNVLAPSAPREVAGLATPGSTNQNHAPNLPASDQLAVAVPGGRTGGSSPAAPNAADQKLAGHWLSNTNDRPVVRVHYDPADILRLVELGRGLIVASSQDKVHPRELYLQSRPDAAPLFVPYTKSVADRFSSYSLILDPSAALAPLTAVFPAYFPDAAVVLAFVPDQVLATDLFAQVARAKRSVAQDFPVSKQMVFEGELTLRGTEPSFNLLQVQSGTTRVLMSAAAAPEPN